MALPVISCPNCKIALPGGTTTCPDCGEDLAPWLKLRLAPYVLYNEGLRLAQAGDLDGAIAKLHEAIAAAPGEASAYVVLGKLYATQGDWVHARQWWEKTIERWPEDEAARKALATLDAREAAQRERAQRERSLQRRRRWLDALIYVGIGGAIVAIVSIGLSAFRPAEPAPTTVAMIASPTTTPTLPEPTIAPPTATPTKLPSPTPIPTATPTPDLAGPVREAIQADPDLSKLNIQVRQEGSSVWLEGEVPTLGVKYQLEALAKTIPGVRLVDVSNLRVVYTIGAGDTLWDISLAMYGRASLWRFIAAANQLSNPRLINPGRALIIPPPG